MLKESQQQKNLVYSDDDSDEEHEVQDQVLEDIQPQNENQIVSSSELASENYIVPQSTHLKLNKKNVIEFSLEDGNRYKAKILNRAGKSTGLYKNAYNIEYTSPEHLCGKKSYVDLDRVKDLSSRDTQEIYLTKDISFDDAMLVELQRWKQNEVYQEVPFSNQKCITVKWVCTMKKQMKDSHRKLGWLLTVLRKTIKMKL